MAARAVLAVCGIAGEARIAARAGVSTLAAPPHALGARLAAVDPASISAVVSFGLAGGLAAGVRPGDLVIAERIVGRESFDCHPVGARLAASLSPRLMVHRGSIVAIDAPVLTPAEKRALAAAHGAIAVDTESHLAARFAEAHGLPFVTLRAVCDPVDQPLPPLAIHAVGANGRLDLPAIVSEIARRPGQLATLPATAWGTARAMRTLRRVSTLLGAGLGLLAIG
ncbi:phosphorylase [Acuticoccus sp. M5D2P5]|uniref:phosphorylase family protein n=1 Tax=Acuticoccus kalidii TaxID=2910977 RepID=UPI001F363465|nr:phosphorylase [Acuticoccus kalidii]MCF3935827.1 phosphorylase [Acuticoccus kalidii]